MKVEVVTVPIGATPPKAGLFTIVPPVGMPIIGLVFTMVPAPMGVTLPLIELKPKDAGGPVGTPTVPAAMAPIFETGLGGIGGIADIGGSPEVIMAGLTILLTGIAPPYPEIGVYYVVVVVRFAT